jgi:hypothetical protein
VLAELLQHVVEEAEACLRARLRFAVEIDADPYVGFLRLARYGRGSRPIDERVRDRVPGLSARRTELKSLDAEIARELDVDVPSAGHRRALAIERLRVHEIAHQADARFAARAAGLRQVRAHEVARETNALRGELRQQVFVCTLERRARKVRAAESALIRDDHELITRSLELEQGSDHARYEPQIVERVHRPALRLGDQRAATIEEQNSTHCSRAPRRTRL